MHVASVATSPRSTPRAPFSTMASDHPSTVHISVPVPPSALHGGSTVQQQPPPQVVYVPVPGGTTPLSALNERPGTVSCKACGQTGLTRTSHVVGNTAK